ncbi:MAG: hypothetical protein RIT28_1773 [Pseudomonadota bacterium]
MRLVGVEARLLTPLVPLQVSDPELHTPVADEVRLYGLRPGLALRLPRPDGGPDRVVTTSALGLRGADRAVDDAALRVLCLGGSTTFGATVSDDETWPAQLEAQLTAQGQRAQVFNAGVNGYMTRQKVAWAEALIPVVRPDVVIVEVYNEGRRFLQLGDDPMARLRQSPSLWAEWIWGAPEVDAAWSPIWRASAGLRVGVIGVNRLLVGRGGWDPSGPLITRATQRDEAAAASLFRQAGEARVWGLIPPAGGPELPWPVIDLHSRYEAVGEPFGSAGREVHPAPEVYGWYAQEIAEALRADLAELTRP